MKMYNAKTTIYRFNDMMIFTIEEIDHEPEPITAVYVEVNSNLEFVFAVPTGSGDDLDIERLHETGYFSEYSYKDKAMRFLNGEVLTTNEQ